MQPMKFAKETFQLENKFSIKFKITRIKYSRSMKTQRFRRIKQNKRANYDLLHLKCIKQILVSGNQSSVS